MIKRIIVFLLLFVTGSMANAADGSSYPDWFKISVLDFRDDLSDVKTANKKFLILFIAQKDCGFCDIHMRKNWSDSQVVAYTRKHFEVLALDARGSRKIVDFYGKSVSEKQYAHSHGLQFTPTLVFVDVAGHEVFRLPGLRSKKQFYAALEYVADEHYKKYSFRRFLAIQPHL